MSYDNSYSGTLNKNGKKEPGSRAPDYKGQININGVGHWLSGWIRRTQEGETFLSIQAEPKDKDKQPQRQAPARQPQRGRQDDSDDSQVPF